MHRLIENRQTIWLNGVIVYSVSAFNVEDGYVDLAESNGGPYFRHRLWGKVVLENF